MQIHRATGQPEIVNVRFVWIQMAQWRATGICKRAQSSEAGSFERGPRKESLGGSDSKFPECVEDLEKEANCLP